MTDIERFASSETISTSPTHNVFGLDLLKEDWSTKRAGRQESESHRSAGETRIDKDGGVESWRGSGTNVGESKAKRLLQDSIRVKP